LLGQGAAEPDARPVMQDGGTDMSQFCGGKTFGWTEGRGHRDRFCSNRFAQAPPAVATAFAIHR